MITGLFFIIVSWVIYLVLGFIGRFASDGQRRRDALDFKIDDLLDHHHSNYWFFDETKEMVYRAFLLLSFCLYVVGVIVFVFNLNCFPVDFNVIMKLFVAFLGGCAAGWTLIVLANLIVSGIPILGIIITVFPLMLWDWLHGR